MFMVVFKIHLSKKYKSWGKNTKTKSADNSAPRPIKVPIVATPSTLEIKARIKPADAIINDEVKVEFPELIIERIMARFFIHRLTVVYVSSG